LLNRFTNLGETRTIYYTWKPNKPKIIPWEDVEKYLNKGYIAEEKRDGARMALHLDSKKIPESVMFNKYRTYDPLRKFPELKGVIDKLLSNMEQQKIKTLTLDGELIVLDSSNKDDFWQLNGRLHLENPMKIKMSTSKVTYVPFDVLEIDGAIFQSRLEYQEDATSRPDHDLYWRREQLQSICANVLTPVKRVKKDVIDIDYCINNNLEGFVLKNPEESYNKTWYKVKAVVESNFNVVSVEEKKQNTVLQLQDEDGNDVGGVAYYGDIDSDRLIGKSVEVRHMRGNTEGLRFPVLNKVLK